MSNIYVINPKEKTWSTELYKHIIIYDSDDRKKYLETILGNKPKNLPVLVEGLKFFIFSK